jgi:hypothetical protein
MEGKVLIARLNDEHIQKFGEDGGDEDEEED